jgi:hypothetical protein
MWPWYQHAMRIRHIVIRGLSAPLYHIFPHYLINGTILGGKIIEYEMCVLIFSTHLCEIHLILRIIQRDIIKNVQMSVGPHVK